MGKIGQFLGKSALKKYAKKAGAGAITSAGDMARDTASEYAQDATSSLKDKAVNMGMGALDVLSGGADEEEDGSWSSKLANLGSTAGNIAGGLAGGAAGMGVGSIATGLAGGAAGGFLGRKVGKLLGTLIDKFTGGNKAGAVKSLAKLIAAGTIPAAALSLFADNISDEEDEDAYSDLLSGVKNRIPTEYTDEVEDAIDATED